MGENKKRPNILYIMTDDHGAGGLSCYGSKINQTPNLDRIANGGMRLNNCYVTCSLCGPSRATILTGKYAHVNGFTSNGTSVFDGSQQTFPKLLQDAGYETAIIGKWHLHSMPTGFDHYSVMWDQGSYFDPDFIEESEEGPVWKKNKGYSTDIVADKCLDWLGQRDTENPFMLLCHFKSPHWTWEPDEKHMEMYRDETVPEPETLHHRYDAETGPPDRLQIKLESVHEHWKITRWGPMPEGLSMKEQRERNFQHFIKDYLRCVASVDDNVGRLLDYLDEQDLAENTVVMYTSDNGMFQGDHGWVDKRMMYEESLRVPFLVRYPEGITAGTNSTDLVTNCDYAPTILDYAGVDVPEDIQGRSLCSVFRADPPEDWRSAFYHQHFSGTPDGEVANCGVRTKDHKLIWYNHHFDHYQLFDVNKDPLEINDVFGDPEYADIVEDMKSLLRQERARVELTDELETQIFKCEGVAETRKQMQAIPKMVTENTERLARGSGK